MLSIKKLGKAGKPDSKGNMPLDYLKSTELKKLDYYRDKDVLPMELALPQWGGAGAKTLNLIGEVDFDALDNLGAGRAPTNDKDLVKGAGDEHQVGWDFTWSAVKSVSMAFVAADESMRLEILRCHQEAVGDAMNYLQSVASSRKSYNGTQKIGVNGLVSANFQHFASRELDVQLHTHSLIFNVAECADGVWRTLDSQSLFENKMAAGALYRSSVASRMAKLGWGVRAEGKDSFEIEGFDTDDIEASSTRSAQIKAEMERTGARSALAKQYATLATRREKDEPAYEALMADWTVRLQGMGYDAQKIQQFFIDAEHKRAASEPYQLDATALLSKLTEQCSTFFERDVVRMVAINSVGHWDAEQCVAEAKALLASSAVIALESHDGKAPRFTSPEMYQLEQETLKSVQARVGETRHHVDHQLVADAIQTVEASLGKGARLNDEQKNAVIHLCEKTGGTGFIEGWAGTGKTTMMSALEKAYTAAGFIPIGCALSGKAAEGLQNEASIASQTLAALLRDLDSGSTELTARHVVVIDEAGMVGSRMFRKLQEHSDRAGAKLVIIGDPKQIQPIDAGGVMRSLMAKNGELRAELAGIQRQKTDLRRLREALKGAGKDGKPVLTKALKLRMGRIEDADLPRWAKEIDAEGARASVAAWEKGYDYQWMREVVTQFASADDRGKSLAASALQTLDDKGLVVIAEDRVSAIESVINDWMTDTEARKDKLILAATKEEVFAVNNAARARLIEAGEIDAGHILRVFINKQGTLYRDFSKGDRILFTAINNKLGVKNGTLGEVLGIFKDGKTGKPLLKVRVDGEGRNAREIIFDPDRVRGVDHGYCVTTHKSQGVTVNSAYVMLNESMSDREWIYVAASRSRFRTKLYGVEMDLGHLLPDNFKKMDAAEKAATRKMLWLKETAQRMGTSHAKDTSMDYELAKPLRVAATSAAGPSLNRGLAASAIAHPAALATAKAPSLKNDAFKPKMTPVGPAALTP